MLLALLDVVFGREVVGGSETGNECGCGRGEL